MTINDFGGNIAKIWDELRPVTKNLVERARLSGRNLSPNTPLRSHYDATADIELSKLLSAVDESLMDATARSDSEKIAELKDLTHTCISLLESGSASAEVFIMLAERAVRTNDYAWLERLADKLAARYSPGEIGEIIRQSDLPQIRAIAYETLAMKPLATVVPMLDDPLYATIAYVAIEAMAYEFSDESAKEFLETHDFDFPMPGF